MLHYTVKRILQAIPLIFLISLISFLLMQAAPYDAVDAITTPDMTPEHVESLKEKYGLDKPVFVQYFYWLKGVAKGEFGYSLVNNSDVASELAERIPNTFMLVLPAFVLALTLALVLGLWSGVKKGKLTDKVIDGYAAVGIAVPTFWLALLLVYFLGFRLGWFPILGMRTIGEEETFVNLLHHLVLPVTVLTLSLTPELIRYVRSSTIGQLNEDYVMVQMAYGESRLNILYKHVLRNVLLPIVTLIGMYLPLLVTGAFVTETIFSWPGVGTYFITAIRSFDYPVVMAVLLLSSVFVIVGNLLADLLYMIIDPRIKRS